MPADIKLHDGSKYQKGPIQPIGMRQCHGQQTKIACHGEHKDGQGKDQPNDQVTSLVGNFLLPGKHLGIFQVFALIYHLKPGFADFLADVVLVNNGGHILHGNSLSS